jgi:DNA polymerase-3 subunit alpha
MAKFADYGFNKSHAAAYALVAYQTAWMKANHPVVFIAACMSLALGNTDKIAAYKQEAERAGTRILPPDINRSGPDFTVERMPEGKLAIRYALAAVKKVGRSAMETLVAARGSSDFADISEFAARIDPRQISRNQIENLARAGTFDSLEPNRARVFAAADTIVRRAQANAEEKESGQIGLFGGPTDKPEALRLPDMPDWQPIERLGFEAEAIGFHLTAHPLDVYAQTLRRIGAISSTQIEAQARAGVSRAKLAGTVIASKERITRTGSRMAWIRLSDASGSYEVTVFSEVLGSSRGILAVGSNVLITVDLKLEGESLRITAQSVMALDQAASNAGAGMRIWLRQTANDNSGGIGQIRMLLSREGAGRGQVILVPRLEDAQSVEIALPGGFNVTPKLAQALKIVPGVERVEEI